MLKEMQKHDNTENLKTLINKHIASKEQAINSQEHQSTFRVINDEDFLGEASIEQHTLSYR